MWLSSCCCALKRTASPVITRWQLNLVRIHVLFQKCTVWHRLWILFCVVLFGNNKNTKKWVGNIWCHPQNDVVFTKHNRSSVGRGLVLPNWPTQNTVYNKGVSGERSQRTNDLEKMTKTKSVQRLQSCGQWIDGIWNTQQDTDIPLLLSLLPHARTPRVADAICVGNFRNILWIPRI